MDCVFKPTGGRCCETCQQTPEVNSGAVPGYDVEGQRKLAKIVCAAYEKCDTMIDAMHFVTDICPDAKSEVIRGMWLALDEL